MGTAKQGILRRLGRALACGLLLGAMALAPARAQTFKSLYSFTGGSDGGYPGGPLIRDAEGNLYGVANSSANGVGNGTVYKLNQRRKLTVLYAFPGEGGNGAHGARPGGGLTRDAKGNFYGTTNSGGSHECEVGPCGVVFKLDPSGNETVLHNFEGTPHDGSNPNDITMLLGPTGILYGTAYFGGSGDCDPNAPWYCGTAFAVASTGHETTIHNFQGKGDGINPWGNMVQDAQGNMYGITVTGGGEGEPTCEFAFGCGTVFKLSPHSDGSWTESKLYSFTGGADGEVPITLAIDAQGNLYGAAEGGGIGWGTLYKLDATGKFSLLYSFTAGSDGYGPKDVVLDAAGNLYGTTSWGGASDDGIVFRLDAAGKFTVLHAFNGKDGQKPIGLSLDKAGTLYGTTDGGGTYGWGTIYKLTP